MKKFMLLATAVGMTLTSCVNEVETPMESGRQVIAFDAPVMKNTRANVLGEIGGVKYPTTENFNVFCKIYKNDYTGWTTSTEIADYFKPGGDEAKHEGGTYWSTDNIYYWPDAGYNLAFAAISPATLGSACTSTKITRGEEGFTITDFVTEDDSEKQYDLMYSHTTYDRDKIHHAGMAVPLLFEHALTSIVFSSQKADASVNYTITDVQVTGQFYTQGTFIQGITGTTSGGTYTEEETPKWQEPLTGLKSVTYIPKAGASISVPEASPEIFTSGTSAILPIPQSVPNDAEVAVTYKKTTSNGITTTHVATILLKDFKKADNSSIEKWERGKRYVYRIAFGKNERIYFEPSVTDWVQEPTLIYTIK